MRPLTAGTLASAGSFRCEQCGYVVTTGDERELEPCPRCGTEEFVRASLFGTGRFQRQGQAPTPAAELAQRARAALTEPGTYLAFEDGGRLRSVLVREEWTRIGRSLAADVRFDDPSVSRRHALLVRGPDGLRVLDDRSLNGVFVNGERVEWRALRYGDELVVGRHRLVVVELAADRSGTAV